MKASSAGRSSAPSTSPASISTSEGGALELKPKTEFCFAFMNAGFGAFNFSSGSALAGCACTAAFAVQRPFSGGAILLMATSFKMSLLAFLACCVWRWSETAWSWAMAPPCPQFDWLGWIICSSVTQPKPKILQYYRTIKRLFDLCSDDGASFSVTLCAFLVCELDSSGSSASQRTHNKRGNGSLPTDGEPLHQAWIIWWLSGPGKISSAIPNPSQLRAGAKREADSVGTFLLGYLMSQGHICHIIL